MTSSNRYTFSTYSLIRSFLISLCLAVGVSGCGGGGGSDDQVDDVTTGDEVIVDPPTGPSVPVNPTPIPTPDIPDNEPEPAPDTPAPDTENLLITEFTSDPASLAGSNVPWFEVYNPSDVPVSLGDYVLRSSWRYLLGQKPSDAPIDSMEPMDFELSSVAIPPKGYLVIGGKSLSTLQNTNQAIFLEKESKFPDWTRGGSIELIKEGRTADFIKYETTSAMPITEEAWVGESIRPAKELTDARTSIVRLASKSMNDTNTASDWDKVPFATPGGPNDILPSAVDEDGDGIPDSAETLGGTYAGLDLYALGARADRKDIFMEIDYMVRTTDDVSHSWQPQEESLQMVVEAFSRKNIALHFDVGNAYSNQINSTKFNLGGGNPIPYVNCLDLHSAWGNISPNCTSFYAYKSRFLDIRRTYIFHYAVAAQNANYSVGIAEYNGNDIALGTGHWTNGQGMSIENFNMHVNRQAGTIMHELGHNFGLHHGGNDSINGKPNHLSVMNYLYADIGLPGNTRTMSASDRARLIFNPTSLCMIENSPCSRSFIIDYSDGSSEDIDENYVVEGVNIGRGSVNGAYADWNGNGILDTTPYVRRITRLEPTIPLMVLKDYDEWNNLSFPFSIKERTRNATKIGLGN